MLASLLPPPEDCTDDSKLEDYFRTTFGSADIDLYLYGFSTSQQAVQKAFDRFIS
jgi:hypothetical protein